MASLGWRDEERSIRKDLCRLAIKSKSSRGRVHWKRVFHKINPPFAGFSNKEEETMEQERKEGGMRDLEPNKSETDCTRLLDRLKEAEQQMRAEVLRLRTVTKALYSSSENKSDSGPAKQEEGWVGDIDTVLNGIDLLISELRAELDWLNKLTGC